MHFSLMDTSKMSEELGNSTEALSHDDDDSSSKWTPFEDSEDYPSDSNSNDSNEEEDNADGLTQRHSADHPQVTSDPETRNLLDDAEDNIDGEEDDLTHKLDNVAIKSREIELDEDVFKISQYQKDYYTHCFIHLQKITQGTGYLNGALNGADERIVEFFRKSGLNTAQLSHIWHLADVNEDGWLNLSEFSVAMHLIVLRVKGGVPIPSKLSESFRPPLTPVRNTSSSHGSTACSTISSSSSRESDFYQTVAAQKSVVPVNGTLVQEPQNPVAEFSDVPPLLVDNRPTAVKSLATSVAEGKFPLSPQARGPPPKPPPRDYRNRGHGRSASLDLNTVFQGQANSIHISSTSVSSTCGCQGQFHTCIPVPGSTCKTSCPTIYAENLAITNSASPQPAQNFAQAINISSSAKNNRTSLKNTETQTDAILWMSDLNEDLDLLLDKTSKNDSTGNETNWQNRCEILRKLNSELEAKRVMLSQIRLQLQLRISEVEDAKKGAQTSGSRIHHGGVTKPTSL